MASPTNSLSPSLEKKTPGVTVNTVAYDKDADPDAEFGGSEARKALEKKLLFKLDLRMVSSLTLRSTQSLMSNLVDLNRHIHLELCQCFLRHNIGRYI